MADRPGALASLAQRCGAAEVNILGLQIFPDVDAVTDELVLSTPDDWALADVAAIVESAGGREVAVSPCTAYALVDGPTNYLMAASAVAEDPSSVREALTELLDGGTGPDELLSTMEVPVAGTVVTIRRTAPFTVTEQARASAFAAVVNQLIGGSTAVVLPDQSERPVFRIATVGDALALVQMAGRCSTGTLTRRFGAPLTGLHPRMARRLLAEGPSLVAAVGDEIVGIATVSAGDRARVNLLVEDAWQRQSVGTGLLLLSARLAKSRGATELVLRSNHDSDVVPRLSAASGLPGRVRHDNGDILLTVPLGKVAPLLQDVEGASGARPLDTTPA